MTASKNPIVVIGAGPAGITAGYQLAKAGKDVIVFEAGPTIGGLAKTMSLWEQRVDVGPHRFFSSDRRVNELWLEVVQRDYQMVQRLTRIYYQKKFFFYPLQPLDALKKLGIIEAVRCVFSYLQEKLWPTPLNGSFENWVVHRFGRRLFTIFFKTYSEKLWGISCQELDSDFAAQRIKKLSLFEAIKHALWKDQSKQHKTLVDEFAYPTQGTGMVYDRMAQGIQERGGQVRCSTPVQRVITQQNQITGIELMDGTVQPCTQVISSMPLSLLVTRLPEVPDNVKAAANSLKFRNTILVYLLIDQPDLFTDNWLYVHSPDLQLGRITNFRNWVPQLYGASPHTILALEYWCNDNDALWQQPDVEITALASTELKETGLIKNAKVLDSSIYKIKRCYPVYEKGYKDKLRVIEEYLNSVRGLSVIGRYGAFKYNNQDHSILMGLLAAENSTAGAQHNLWSINTDYDSYQEGAIITKTGLQSQHV